MSRGIPRSRDGAGRTTCIPVDGTSGLPRDSRVFVGRTYSHPKIPVDSLWQSWTSLKEYSRYIL